MLSEQIVDVATCQIAIEVRLFMRERATAHYEALDADGNGELTVEEFTASVADHAQRR